MVRKKLENEEPAWPKLNRGLRNAIYHATPTPQKKIFTILTQQNMNMNFFMTILCAVTLFDQKSIGTIENGEKNSKYFLNLENTRSGKIAVRRLFYSNGKITVNPQSILHELKNYYQNLYSNQDHNLSGELYSDFLENNSVPALSEQSMLVCEGKLSLTEYYKVLQKFSNGRAPGNDGLTAEFYKCFWNL